MVQTNSVGLITDGNVGEGLFEQMPNTLSQSMAAATKSDEGSYDEQAHAVIGGKLVEILDAKGDNKGKYLMSAKIVSDLTDGLTTLMSSTRFPAQTVQIVNNHIQNMRRYTGNACPKAADQYLHDLEASHGIITSERHDRMMRYKAKPPPFIDC